MKGFVDMLNSTLAKAEEERILTNNQFDKKHLEKIDKIISKISKEYEDLETVVDRCIWFEIDVDLEVGVKAFTQKIKHEQGSSEEQFQYSVLQYKKVTYALNSKAEGQFLGGYNEIKPLKEVLLPYLKNEDLIKATIREKFNKDFNDILYTKTKEIRDKKELDELINCFEI